MLQAASKQRAVNLNELHRANNNVQIARLSSLGKLCSLLCIIHYKIMYKDINNVTINFGSRHAGFPLDIFKFLNPITVSPKCPTVYLHISTDDLLSYFTEKNN